MTTPDSRRAHVRVAALAMAGLVVLLLVGLDETAAVVVAIALFACAAVARAVVWTGLGGRRVRATARRYLEPLSVWCAGAVVVHLVAASVAGGLRLGSFALAVALGGAALLLWLSDDRLAAVEPPPVADPEPTAQWPQQPREAADPPRLWSRG